MIPVFNQIADGLAEYGYAIADQFLSQEHVGRILALEDFKEGVQHFRKAGIGKDSKHQVNEGIRGDYIRWLDKSSTPEAAKEYLDQMHELMAFLNQSLFLSLKDIEVHFTIYPAGSSYKRHIDQFKHDDHRKLSVLCYLNEGWRQEHGGKLRMYVGGSNVDVLPIAGRLVCFRSDQIEHEVLPATRSRLSLTGWMLDQVADLRHL